MNEEQKELSLIDCHVHMRGMASLQNLTEVIEECGLDAMNVISIPRTDEKLITNILGLLFKTRLPGKVYAFGSLRHPQYGDIDEPLSYEEQARNLLALGCDGIKMIEGKPTTRKKLGVPLDDSRYDKFYSYLEDRSVPLLFHVNDPESFWDPGRIRPGARERGWFYGDGTFPSYEELYAESANVLAKHPRLNVLFAHFYFLSDDLDRLEDFMSEHPNVKVDITPGSEMYRNFSRRPERAREFFIDHAGRIFFGTDISGDTEPDPEMAGRERDRIQNMRRFLETGDEFEWWGMDLKGIDLPREALAAIYAGNFRRWAGKEPKAVGLSAVSAECSRLAGMAREAGKQDVAEAAENVRDLFPSQSP